MSRNGIITTPAIAELAQVNQWVLWRYIEKNGKATKVPFRVDGKAASSTDPATWSTYQACLAARKGDYGLGFVFSGDDPYVGIDLDACLYPDGSVAWWAKPYLAQFKSYAEVSPSGTGIKIIIKGKLPPRCKSSVHINAEPIGGKSPGIEIYQRGRYFTITGNVWAGRDTIRDDQPALDSLLLGAGFIKRAAQTQAGHTNGAQNVRNRKERSEGEWASAYLARLSSHRASGYSDWLAVGCCLRSLGAEGLALWDSWSRQSDKYSEGDCSRRWAGLPSDDAGIAKLGAWANEDDPGGKSQWQGKGRGAGAGANVRGDQRPDGGTNRVPIPYTDRNLPFLREEVWGAVLSSPYAPKLFRRGDGLVLVEPDSITPITEPVWKHIVANCVSLFETVGRGKNEREVERYPDKALITDTLLPMSIPAAIRTVHRVTDIPVVVQGTSGSFRIVDQPGYDADSGVLYRPSCDVPTDCGLETAFTFLNNLLGDFPFASDSDRANAVGLLLLPFVRNLIDGPTPMHLIEAARAGTGKSLLAKLFAIIWHGAPAPMHAPLSPEHDEQNKTLVGILHTNPETVIFDNVTVLGGVHLDNALTAETFSGRLLGGNTSSKSPVRCTWIATGNNVSVVGDTPRRVVPIRIIALDEDPSLRDGFRIPNIQAWTKENRGGLIRACLTIVNYGLSQKDTADPMRIGSYESYSAILGRILSAVGIDGFLCNLSRARENDTISGWRWVVDKWWAGHGRAEITARELWETIRGDDCPLFFRGDSEGQQTRSLGYQLKKQIGAVYNIVDEAGITRRLQIIQRSERGKYNVYALVELLENPGKPGSTGEEVSQSPRNVLADQSAGADPFRGSRGVLPSIPSPCARAHVHACAEKIGTQNSPASPASPELSDTPPGDGTAPPVAGVTTPCNNPGLESRQELIAYLRQSTDLPHDLLQGYTDEELAGMVAMAKGE